MATLGVTAINGIAPASTAPTSAVTFYDTTTSTVLGNVQVVTTSQTITGTGITTYTSTAVSEHHRYHGERSQRDHRNLQR